MKYRYRYRVHFTPEGTPPRDVTASSAEAARLCALRAERLTGNKTRGLRATFVNQLWAVGRNAPNPEHLFAPTDGAQPA